MAEGDWYRNSRWDDQIAATFESKLARTRSQKAQYLKIQAGCLARTRPDVCLQLIERYFATGDELFVAQACAIRGDALSAMGKTAEALQEFKRALAREETHPQVLTEAWSGFCKLVVEERIEAEYEFALVVLGRDRLDGGGPFPLGRYIWNGCNALIYEDLGQREVAKQFAENALRAASEEQSPFPFHRKLGLVGKDGSTFMYRLETLVT